MIYTSMVAYHIGDLVLVDPNTEYKYAGKIMRIKRVRKTRYGYSYEVELPNDPWECSTYKHQHLSPVQVATPVINDNQEDKEMEVFKKMVKAHELGRPTSEYKLALFGYDNATEQEMADMKNKFIVARIVSRGLMLLKVSEVSDNDDLTTSVVGEVVSFVDTAAYDERMANRVKKAELRKQMDFLIASKSEMQTYQRYAELFPDVAELFNEYKEL